MDPYKKDKFLSLMKLAGIIIIAAIAIFFLVKFFARPDYNITSLDVIKKDFETSFSENQGGKIIIYLENNNSASVKRGESFGVAFAVRNFGDEGNFAYSVMPIEGNCPDAEKMITRGATGSSSLETNKTWYGLIRAEPSQDMEKCQEKFRINVEKNKISYSEAFFTIKVV
jgi:hypothetical protein